MRPRFMEDTRQGGIALVRGHNPGACCHQTNVLSLLGVLLLSLLSHRSAVTGAMLLAINIDHRAETLLSRIRTDNAKAILQKRSETERSLHSTCNCCARTRLFSVHRFSADRRFTHFC